MYNGSGRNTNSRCGRLLRVGSGGLLQRSADGDSLARRISRLWRGGPRSRPQHESRDSPPRTTNGRARTPGCARAARLVCLKGRRGSGLRSSPVILLKMLRPDGHLQASVQGLVRPCIGPSFSGLSNFPVTFFPCAFVPRRTSLFPSLLIQHGALFY